MVHAWGGTGTTFNFARRDVTASSTALLPDLLTTTALDWPTLRVPDASKMLGDTRELQNLRASPLMYYAITVHSMPTP